MGIELTELPLSLFRGLPNETRTKVTVSPKLRFLFEKNTHKVGSHLLWKKTRKDRNAWYEGVQFSTRRLAWLVHRGTPIPDDRNVQATCNEPECLVHLELIPGSGRKYGTPKRKGEGEVVGTRQKPATAVRRTRTPAVGTPLLPRATVQADKLVGQAPPLPTPVLPVAPRKLARASESLKRVRVSVHDLGDPAYTPPTPTRQDDDTMLAFLANIGIDEPAVARSNGKHKHARKPAEEPTVPQPPPPTPPDTPGFVMNEAELDRLVQSAHDKVLHRLKDTLRPMVEELVLDMKADLWVLLSEESATQMRQMFANMITGAQASASVPVLTTPAPTPVPATRTYTVPEAVEELANMRGGEFLELNDPTARYLLIYNPKLKKNYVAKVSKQPPYKYVSLVTMETFIEKKGGGFFSEHHRKKGRELGMAHEHASRFVHV